MATRRRRPQLLAVKAAELAFAVPQVVAHRVARMAIAGPKPSARDRKEFARMVAEQNAAFGESFNAMAAQAVRADQAPSCGRLRLPTVVGQVERQAPPSLPWLPRWK
jgi:hypothetical protein